MRFTSNTKQAETSATTTSDKPAAQAIASALRDGGVRHAVVCPGSRNVPLTIALNRTPEIRCVSVIDERCAAFVALGIARATCEPVAIVCTSGTAMLNCAPALAEAYYSETPLIIISADRPARLIDQDDSQTIRQPGALANFTKLTRDIPDTMGDGQALADYAYRVAAEAIGESRRAPQGPVHVNVQLDTPLGQTTATPTLPRRIATMHSAPTLGHEAANELVNRLITAQRVLVLEGFHGPNVPLQAAIGRFTDSFNAVRMAEPQSNPHDCHNAVLNPEIALAALSEEQLEGLAPDILITVGRSITSKRIKHWLRKAKGVEHWSVGITPNAIDTYGHLSERIEVEPTSFFDLVANAASCRLKASEYRREWLAAESNAVEKFNGLCAGAPWCDLTAVRMLCSDLAGYDLSLSNGMAIRYAALCNINPGTTVDCNRGVSGIDGSTSTAIGRAMVSDRPQLLITGDMSAQYDMGALAIKGIPPTMRIAVLCNGSGGIFNYINTTRQLPELDELISPPVRLPLKQLADGFGFGYLEAASEAELRDALGPFLREPSDRPIILAIHTDAATSADVLRDIFDRLRNQHII